MKLSLLMLIAVSVTSSNASALASTEIQIKPGQSIEVADTIVSCSKSISKPKPPLSAQFDVLYCKLSGSSRYSLNKNSYSMNGKIISEGVVLLEADSQEHCFYELKNRQKALPRAVNFSCGCEASRISGLQNLVKKGFNENGQFAGITMGYDFYHKENGGCPRILEIFRSNDPTCY